MSAVGVLLRAASVAVDPRAGSAERPGPWLPGLAVHGFGIVVSRSLPSSSPVDRLTEAKVPRWQLFMLIEVVIDPLQH
jgi:hypothetical protein